MEGIHSNLCKSVSDIECALTMALTIEERQISSTDPEPDQTLLDLISSLIHAKEYIAKAQAAINTSEGDAAPLPENSRPPRNAFLSQRRTALTQEELMMLWRTWP